MISGDTFSGSSAQLRVVAAAFLLAAFALWHFAALRSRIPIPRALALTLLRGAAVTLVLVLITGPSLIQRTFNPVRRPLAVVVDTSRSMGLHGGLERTRLDRVRDFLETREFRRVAAGFVPAYFSISDSLSPITRDGIRALQATGPRTDLPSASDRRGGA